MKKGFTVVELLVSIGILMTLFALTTINLTGLPSSAFQNSSLDRLVSDLRSQQTKAMVGFDSGAPPSGGVPYGVHFEDASYTIFTGLSYSSSDPNNFVVSLDPSLTFTEIRFPNSQVVFEAGTGDIAGYSVGNDSVSITDAVTGVVKSLRLNKYGATY